jgi:hypothetical protein
MMRALHSSPSATPSDTLQVRVLGPESPAPTPSDLRRLFAGRSLSRARRERIASATKVVAQHGGRVLGLAAYERAGEELRVSELAVEPTLCFGVHDLLEQLLDAIELACLAGGCRRLVLLPAAVVSTTPLERLGFQLITEGCAGGWLEKRFY